MQRLGFFQRVLLALFLGLLGSEPIAAQIRPPWGVLTVMPATNIGARLDRDRCLVASVGPAAAVQCGDLRVLHKLPPTVRTFNAPRNGALVYNSGLAHPYPLVAANVSVIGPRGISNVSVYLVVNGATKAFKSYSGNSFGGSTRIVIGYDAANEPTGAYPYTLVVFANLGGFPSVSFMSGTLVVVRRSESRYGAGWWVSGVEQLYFPAGSNDILWVGSDGSYRVYAPTAANHWQASTLDRIDTIRWDASLSRYVRELPGRAKIQFDRDGRHSETVRRTGQTTRFEYASGATSPEHERLSRIWLPIPGGEELAYDFFYGGDGLLDRVQAPGPDGSTRVTEIRRSGTRVDEIVDADELSVGFGYGAAAGMNRMMSRTGRAGYTTTYAYGDAGKVIASTHGMRGTGPDVGFDITPFETVGFRSGESAATAHALIDGPRTDVADTTEYYFDSTGGVAKVLDALGNETKLIRQDERFPGLVTRVELPNGHSVTAGYDDRGNVLSIVNGSTGAMSSFEYRNALWPDFVTRIAQAEGEITEIGYDSHGNRVWQQDGSLRVSKSGQSGGVYLQLRRASDRSSATPIRATKDRIRSIGQRAREGIRPALSYRTDPRFSGPGKSDQEPHR